MPTVHLGWLRKEGEMMPVVEGEYSGTFTADFYRISDGEKFDLIEAIIHGDSIDIEGSAEVTLEFDLADYAPDR